ncbi:hypothetical protein KM043_001213 [Ampulex compressa]|nr:hypothetical protein KM043_001213 [Ampulex compressa]
MAFLTELALVSGAAHGIRCYKCGQYNEGVGSITPCLNNTAHMHPKECPAPAEWCIKYVSEGSTVRDCVPNCVEKDAWSTKTFCCKQDGCNSGPLAAPYGWCVALAASLAAALAGRGLRG